jgi:hypothetical protein
MMDSGNNADFIKGRTVAVTSEALPMIDASGSRNNITRTDVNGDVQRA